MEKILNHRYIARLKIEAKTPLFVGSGSSSLLKDALVQKDHHGLPMIPGTSLAGVLRHSIEALNPNKHGYLKDIFGYQSSDSNEGRGSRLKVSAASFLLENDNVAENLATVIPEKVSKKMDHLPVRQHVRINDKGAAEKNGLFDNEVVHKGARFVFEVELKGTAEDKDTWQEIIEIFKSPAFRVGQGTRNGYGNLEVIKLFEKDYNLEKENDFEAYLNFDPSFNALLPFVPVKDVADKAYRGAVQYTLSLEPDDFFIFSEGFGDDEVDNKPITEEVMEYSDGKIEFVEQTLIPGSSIKGALAHRVAYHHNKRQKNFADQLTQEPAKYLGEENAAVTTLFGKKGEIKKNERGKGENVGQSGIILIDDLYYDDIDNEKIFNHVAIDRFTGGGIDGALFSEKVSYKKDGQLEFKITLTKLELAAHIQNALEDALKDICKGLLPLGGMTTKGFGMFTGALKKDGKVLFDYKNEMA